MSKRDRRADIMAAAEKLFATARIHEVTLDDVVREAGVGKGTIYRYFKDKDDLFFQTAVNGFEELCELLERTSPGQVSFDQQLLDLCQEIGAFSQKRRSLFRMMQTEESRLHECKGELRRQWMSRREKLASAMAGVLSRGAAEGAIRRDVPPLLLARVLLGILRAHTRDLPGDGTSLGVVVNLFLDGARPGAPRGNGELAGAPVDVSSKT